MFRPNELTNLLCLDKFSGSLSKVKKVPEYFRGVADRYGHEIKKGLEFVASPEGEAYTAAAMSIGGALAVIPYSIQNATFQRDCGPYLIAFNMAMALLVLHSWKRLK